MNNNVKYYIIALENVFLNDSKMYIHFAVGDHGKYYDLLTNKEIYMLDEVELYKEEFINSNCKLIGTEKYECNEAKVALYLRFMTESAKNILIDEVNKMEESIRNSLNNHELASKNKVKRIKKDDFLMNY